MNRNAIIMAAGLSTRFVPLSMEIPKALLSVRGEVLIERQIRQLREAGIQEIVVVTGYLKEQFQYLQEKYDVIIIENPVYKTRNNHSTLYVAREYLKNTFICSGDNYFTENVFLEQSEKAYYASVFDEGKTEEWCLKTDESGRIEDVVIGGEDAWVMKGHAWFTGMFSKKMTPLLEEAYHNKDKKDRFWEEIYMEHIKEMDLFIHKYDGGIIEEFDSIEELRAFDQTYVEHSGSSILKALCDVLKCRESEIKEIKPLKECGEINGFCFEYKEKKYAYSFATKKVDRLSGLNISNFNKD